MKAKLNHKLLLAALVLLAVNSCAARQKKDIQQKTAEKKSQLPPKPSAVYAKTAWFNDKPWYYSEYDEKNQEVYQIVFPDYDSTEMITNYRTWDTAGHAICTVSYRNGILFDSTWAQYTYDEKGREIIETSYDSTGSINTVIDYSQEGYLSVTTTYEPGQEKRNWFYKDYYNEKRQLVKTQYKTEENPILRTYNPDGTEKTITHSNGDVDEFYYDKHQNQVKIIHKTSEIIKSIEEISYNSENHEILDVYTYYGAGGKADHITRSRYSWKKL
jgi:hypothetical protein